MNFRSLLAKTGSICLVLFLAACGGGSDSPPPPAATYTIGGTVTGLAAGQQVTLLNNGGNAKVVAADGAYTFTTAVAANGNYAVTVGTQPTGQTCSVANGSGAGVTANVTNANVTCSSITFTIGGTVSGLAAGEQVTLNNNGADATIVAADGAYTFAVPVPFNGSYAVTVGTQPAGKTCSVSNGAGAGVTANVSNANITCSAVTFTIGGTVTGLAAGEQVTLNNNGADATIVAADGAYTFATPVAFSGSYAVTVGTQPTGKTCSVANGAGAGVTASITNANITCSAITFTIGGTVTGLAAGQQVTLLNNGGDAKTASTNSAYTFTTPVPFNGSFAVTVGTQPTGQTCSVSGGAGAGITANVTNANITCSTITFTVGGTVSGLAAGQQVTLLNNGGNAKVVTADGAYTFTSPVNYNGSYAVTVGTQPTGQTCTVSNGSGANVTGDVTNANIACSTNTFTIGGTISGLVSTQQVTLNNNGGNPLTVTVASGGNFTFTTPIAYNTGYAVTVGTQPTAAFCRVTNGTGANVLTNVTTVSVSCRPATAYVANSADGTVSQYTIGVDDGALTSLGTAVAAGTTPRAVAVDPTGRYAYVANYGGATISQYTIGADGSLSAMTTATVATEVQPWGLVVHPSGQYVYATNRGSNTVSQFSVGADGALTPMAPAATAPTGTEPFGITISPDGQHAYVANFGNGAAFGTSVSQYSIGVNGALTAMSVPTVATGNGPTSVSIAGGYAYVSNYFDSTVSQFTIGSGGELTASGTPAIVTNTSPWPVSITPNGQYAYWSNEFWDTISQCTIGALGALDCSAGTVGTGKEPQYIAIDPSGRFAYAVNNGNGATPSATVSQYTIDPTTGLLAPISGAATAATGNAPYAITTTR